MADGLLSASDYQQEQLMKSMCLAALTGALAISTMALAIDVASAATRYGVYRGGVNRVGVARVGVARVGVGRVGIGYGGAGVGYGRWAGYRPGYGLGYRRYGLGAAAVAGAAVGAGYYAGGAYDAYASGGYDAYASGDANAAYELRCWHGRCLHLARYLHQRNGCRRILRSAIPVVRHREPDIFGVQRRASVLPAIGQTVQNSAQHGTA